ncbi:hypothetical protein AKJ41_04720 [candidate division MSBL1 archaeon SCGC-AAA259O05]|uniref:Protein NO VEIN C-terminal domain-containing protein n=1 Tax=candidate division MSBL1 archaeon SCGC-AAA259O05 TaxID=1698271 RepID=A0A133V0B1_9EURY|nr:hypothetical protein AKJ41_04720 [candidate division MSBL1 archaeon SCGC-AAA259O05]
MSRISRRGINYVIKYEKEKGREPIDVSKSDSHIGFDVISTGEKEARTIEVKATESETGIPDAFSTEFTRDMKFVASHLYIWSDFSTKKQSFV